MEIGSPLLKRLHQDWDARRRGREFPAREDFDPVDLAYILGHMSLVDVMHAPRQFRYRLLGSKVADRLGFELTGKFLDALPAPNYRELIRDHFEAVIEARAPMVVVRDQLFTDDKYWNCEALVLPLSADGTRIDILMTALAWK